MLASTIPKSPGGSLFLPRAPARIGPPGGTKFAHEGVLTLVNCWALRPVGGPQGGLMVMKIDHIGLLVTAGLALVGIARHPCQRRISAFSRVPAGRVANCMLVIASAGNRKYLLNEWYVAPITGSTSTGVNQPT